MPLLSTAGAASHRGFSAYGSTSGNFIVATGGTIYVDPTNADYKIHEFTSSGTFSVTAASLAPEVEVMMVGGGGGGGFGGGGGGGYIYRSSLPVSTGSFSVTVGAGGAGGGVSGGDTTFSTLVALGGGGKQQNGGSGGGGDATSINGSPVGGAALQPTSASGGYGNAGADAASSEANGGGGGAGSAASGSEGGSGRTADIISSSGTFETFAAGGWGSNFYSGSALPAATANSGNGGWGALIGSSFQGGQAGIVRIRYQFQ
jgi:hypothetical protein